MIREVSVIIHLHRRTQVMGEGALTVYEECFERPLLQVRWVTHGGGLLQVGDRVHPSGSAGAVG